MVERALEWDLLEYADYTALDSHPDNRAAALARLARWAEASGYQTESELNADLVISGSANRLRLWFNTIDIFDFIRLQKRIDQWDLLIANAFLDLVDVPATLPGLLGLVKPGGLFYFSINFDGVTIFEPIINTQLDAKIVTLYHRTMDERLIDGRISGDSRAGRHLFAHLQAAGAQILAAGSSDWVVYSDTEGYPHEEAYFLHFIINTVHGALKGHPELDPDQFQDWINQRHAQVETGQLIYIAHQLDFLSQTKG
jgi:hypothetical protein